MSVRFFPFLTISALCLSSAGLLADCLALSLSSHKGHLVPQFHVLKSRTLIVTHHLYSNKRFPHDSFRQPSALGMGTGSQSCICTFLDPGTLQPLNQQWQEVTTHKLGAPSSAVRENRAQGGSGSQVLADPNQAHRK